MSDAHPESIPAHCPGVKLGAGAGLALAAAVALGGCSTAKPRQVHSEEELGAISATKMQDARQTFGRTIEKVIARMETEADPAGNSTLDFLALSGGGDYGAFGAGFLVGWGESPAPEWRRPDFDVVSGVSTGALLAPFAYVGTDESCAQVEAFYRAPKPDWVRERGLLYFMPSNPSLMEIPGLERDIRKAVDAPFIAKMAEQSRKGKVMIVSATDLDFGRQMLWDVGAEAEQAGTKEGDDKVGRILLASSAIPAIFPPVEIGGSAYADGGVTANVLVKLDVKSPHALIPRWKAMHPGKPLPKIRYWIIFNNQMQQPPKTVQIKWPKVMSPSLATAIRSATIAELRWLAAEAEYANAVHGTDIEVRVVAIPNDWRPPVEGDFKVETMKSLADVGRRLGADPKSWQLWVSKATSRPDAPPTPARQP